MKKLLIMLCMAVVLLSGCSKNEAKFVGSRDTEGFSCDIEVYENINDLYADSELVVLGTADSMAEVTENFNGELLYASKIKFNIKEVIKGDSGLKTVNVLQTGKPDSDNYETKLNQNGEYILYLNSKTFNGETVYDMTGIEQGIFEVDKNGKLYSYVDFGVSATLDNKSVSTLKQQNLQK